MKWPALVAFAASVSTGNAEVSFNREVRPILSDKCYYCHGTDPNHRKGDRRLDTRDGALADNDGIKAIVPGKPDDSDVIIRILSKDDDELMPPRNSHKTLTDAEKETLRKWVAEGAKYEPHWAFVAPTRPTVPAGANAIDYFIEQRLKQAGVAFSPEVEKGALLRRVTFDLTGIPPTPEELNAFETDKAPGAYERAVDRLLASPRFGEAMATPWLDLARYSDTNGYQNDAMRMNWPWRDWVIRAFNKNMPFDQFTIEQLAGDLLPNPTQDQLVATAFNRNHMLNNEGGNIPEENRVKYVFDRAETTGTVWLGLTFNCTQCHDHKFDPLTQRDYYSLFAMFNQLSETGASRGSFNLKIYDAAKGDTFVVEPPSVTVVPPELQASLDDAVKNKGEAKNAIEAAAGDYQQPFRQWVQELRANRALVDQRISDKSVRPLVNTAPVEDLQDGDTQKLLKAFLPSQPQWKKLQTAAEAELRKRAPQVMIMRDDKPRHTRIFNRGNYETPGDKVQPAVPAILPPLPPGVKADRLAFARWLMAPENPLTARVTVNRFWQQIFGRGLVKTPDDFGLQGELPSHPELLDWLAVEFLESKWDVKHLLRLLVTSRTYRQSAKATPELLAKDPENILLARGPRIRLDSRALRDQALALSGLLVERQGGRSVMPYQPPGVWEEMSFGVTRYHQGKGPDLYRRSLYTFWRRAVGPTSFFDVPARQFCVVKPYRTNTPLHALTTLNDITYAEAARVWAEKLLSERKDDSSSLMAAFCAATGLPAKAQELAALGKALEKARTHFASREEDARKLASIGEFPRNSKLEPKEHAAWASVCLLILNLDETLTH